MISRIYFSHTGDGSDEMPGFDEVEMTDIEGLDNSVACSVAAECIEMNQSASLVLAGDEVIMIESTSLITLADQVDANKSSMFLVIADEVHGEYSTVFTPQTAAIFGVAAGVAIFVLSMIFRPFCRR
ncbi:MAG: hypothetical protein NTY09_07825 [bacterium]|nr:hypothetical protein [bacterium]